MKSSYRDKIFLFLIPKTTFFRPLSPDSAESKRNMPPCAAKPTSGRACELSLGFPEVFVREAGFELPKPEKYVYPCLLRLGSHCSLRLARDTPILRHPLLIRDPQSSPSQCEKQANPTKEPDPA